MLLVEFLHKVHSEWQFEGVYLHDTERDFHENGTHSRHTCTTYIISFKGSTDTTAILPLFEFSKKAKYLSQVTF